MNLVLIAVIGILAGYILTGYAKGFLKIVYSLISWFVILVFVVCVTPYIEDFIKNETEIYNKVVIYCEEALQKQTQQMLENSNSQTTVSENELFAVIADKLPPKVLEELENKTSELAEGLKNQTSEMAQQLFVSQGIYGKTAIALADLFLRGVSTAIAMILGAIASRLVSAVLGFIEKLPLIGLANRILGLAAGAANGLLIIWLAFYLVAVMCTTEWGSDIISQIYANEFLIYLYENNLILSFLL